MQLDDAAMVESIHEVGFFGDCLAIIADVPSPIGHLVFA